MLQVLYESTTVATEEQCVMITDICQMPLLHVENWFYKSCRILLARGSGKVCLDDMKCKGTEKKHYTNVTVMDGEMLIQTATNTNIVCLLIAYFCTAILFCTTCASQLCPFRYSSTYPSPFFSDCYRKKVV